MGVLMTIADMFGQTGTWPPPDQRRVWEDVELFQAFLTSDEVRIRQEASVAWNERYLLSPVPRMVSRAKANLLFGETPELGADNESDQERLDFLAEEQGLIPEFHRAAVLASAEGEVWGRVVVDPSACDVPIIDFCSRSRVVPHFNGRFVEGATFVTTWSTTERERFRLLETYTAGLVESRLYRGTTTRLGLEVDLGSFPATAGKQERVLTGIDWPMVAFIPNSIDADPCRGYSDYQGMRDRFLALNDAVTAGQNNLDIAGRKRALVDGEYLTADGRLPKGDDVFVKNNRVKGDGVQASPLQVIDYAFDADQVIAWVNHLVDSTLMLSGVSPQLVGRSVDGGAVSGTAMKLKAAHSLLEASGTGRYMDRGISRLLHAAQIIDSRPTTEGGFGRKWSNPDAAPSVQRQDGLPRDDMEAAQQLVAMTNADAISVDERVRFLHPDWTEQQVADEVARIEGETSTVLDPTVGLGMNANDNGRA